MKEVEDISPALEATEDFLHCLDGGGGQGGEGVRQPRQHHPKLQEMSVALGKLSSSGVWGLLAREQGTEVSPRNVAWADQPSAFSVLALRQGKRDVLVPLMTWPPTPRTPTILPLTPPTPPLRKATTAHGLMLITVRPTQTTLTACLLWTRTR